MKAVIPVAGLGTRMLPATKAIPKEMLPVVDKPLIQYVVNEAILAGIKEIVLVTHSSKNSIENHFDTSFELEVTLEQRIKRQLLEEVRSICPNDVTIIHVRQKTAKGLGHAVRCAYPCIGNSPFAVLLPDVLIDESMCDFRVDNLSQMLNRFNTSGKSQIMVEQVPIQDVVKYGIADIEDKHLEPGSASKINGIVEKPSVECAPSRYSAVGRYVFSPKIWQIIDNTLPDTSGEIQLTDAIASLINCCQVDAYAIVGKSHDCGNKKGYIKAILEHALRDPQVSEAVRNFIDENSILPINKVEDKVT